MLLPATSGRQEEKPMSMSRRRPGEVRDAIVSFLTEIGRDASVAEIREAVGQRLTGDVPASSVRSYLNLNTPALFERTARGRYRLRPRPGA
jgi:site-specific DNA-methyltransferase (adenine-specific)